MTGVQTCALPICGAQKKSKLSVGTVVDFNVTPKHRGTNTLKVRGQVVWKRQNKEAALRAGVGVRFLDMNNQDQQVLDSLLQAEAVASFIPMGTSGDRVAN